MKAASICNIFLGIESLEITPKNIPRKIIQIKIIRKEIRNVTIPASETKKNGNKATTPPKNGAPPFIKDTTLPVK
ncbi:MAG: hypothetical protein ACTSQJ_11645, partial [Promethearchaeota archaeon]